MHHTEQDKELLTFVASHIGSALSRARAIEETRQRNAELALINDVQRGLAENLDMQAMYDLVGDRIRDIFDAQVVDIAILDEPAGLIRFPYTIERGVRFPDEAIEVVGPRRHVLETRQPLVFNDRASERVVASSAGQRCSAGSLPSRWSSCRSWSARGRPASFRSRTWIGSTRSARRTSDS